MKQLIIAFCWALAIACGPAGAASTGGTTAGTTGTTTLTAPVKALVLYDQGTSGPYKKLGFAYAIMLRNLLGHFNAAVDMYDVGQYPQSATYGKKIDDYQAVFYVGALYDNPLPSTFLYDVSQTQKTVVWFKYNIWKVADAAFASRFGFGYGGLYGLNATPTASNPAPGFFDTVSYKGNSLVKFYAYDASTGTVSADPDVGYAAVSDPSKALVKADIQNPTTGQKIPYIVNSGNFWYVADMPFSFIGPRDRYLAICDILHDMLGVNHAESHRALVRLEDVDAKVDPTAMNSLTDYLAKQKIPFSIALIPFYRDPLGWFGTPEEIHLAQASTLKNSLKLALQRGGKILMHGYTHQYASTPNLHTAVSADDFEFWFATENRPVDEDSQTWADGRLVKGLKELSDNGFTAFAFEVPHYQASASASRAIAARFAKTYQRAVYYTADKPDFSLSSPDRDFSVGQFFPYIIEKDYYGQRVLPENLGNIEYNISQIDPFSDVVYTWKDIVLNAQYAQLVRDGFASFFFHPFWAESGIVDVNGNPVQGLQDFQSTIKGISGFGFTWVGADGL